MGLLPEWRAGLGPAYSDHPVANGTDIESRACCFKDRSSLKKYSQE